MDWEDRAIARHAGKKVLLESLDKKNWIIPKKLDLISWQKISKLRNTIDIEGLDEKARKKKLKEFFGTEEASEMFRLSMLKGVQDHEFDEKKYKRNDKGEYIFEKEGNKIS
jgi:hypothetical protein